MQASPHKSQRRHPLQSHIVLLLVGCITSQQQASVSHGRVCTDNFTCCHTEIQIADQTFYLTQSQYTDTGPTSPSADPIRRAPGRVATGVPIFKSLVWLDPEKSRRKRDSNTGSSVLEADALTTRPTYHVARNTCCTLKALDVLHVICTRLRPGHLSVCVGDGSRRSEEIVKNLELRLSMRLYSSSSSSLLLLLY